MFKRFTEPTRKVMALANQKAQRFNHEYIGGEHILLGLIQCDGAIGLMILKNLHVDVEHLRSQIDVLIRESPHMGVAQTFPRPHANEVVTRAIREADAQRHQLVDTGHILLGLAHQDTSALGQMLKNLGVTPETVREEVLRLNQAGADGEPPS